MTKIGFIGIGNMGRHMARNLLKAGHHVTAFDLSQAALDAIASDGAAIAGTAGGAVRSANVVITMLPAGKHVASVYDEEILPNAQDRAVFIDCSTIDVDTSRRVAAAAKSKGHSMLDAPVSGGVGGAEAGTLTFMVGGDEDVFTSSRRLLDCMGKNIVHCGGPGTGQAAKMCNNMMLGIQMVSVAEAFVLAEALGLEHQKLFDVASTASGQCWSLTTYCPVPGPVPGSPANQGYQPGFATALMIKDLNLALDAAARSGARLDVAHASIALYESYFEESGSEKDFSGIVNLIRERVGQAHRPASAAQTGHV